jgi:hypothetical protein
MLTIPILISAVSAQLPDFSCLGFFTRKVSSTALKPIRCIGVKSTTQFADCYRGGKCPATTLDQWVVASYDVAKFFNSVPADQLKKMVATTGGTASYMCADDILSLGLPAKYTPNMICTARVMGPFTGPSNLITAASNPFPSFPNGISNDEYFSVVTAASNNIYRARGII